MEWLIELLPFALIFLTFVLVMHLFMRGTHGGHGGHEGSQHRGQDSAARIADIEKQVAELRADEPGFSATGSDPARIYTHRRDES